MAGTDPNGGDAGGQAPPRDVGELCIEQIEALELNKHPLSNVAPEEFANTLVEKGVLSFTSDDRVDASIPTMTA